MLKRDAINRLIFAVAGSLAVHAWVMSSTRLDLAAPPQLPPPLEARLEPVRAPATVQTPAPAPKRKPAVTRRVAAKTPAIPVRRSIASTSLYVPPEWDLDPGPDLDGAPVAKADTPPSEAPSVAENTPPELPVNPLPRKGQIEYSVRYGSEDGLPVGKIVQSWEMKNGRYLLASDGETTGLLDLFRPQQLRYISQGQITSRGLKPEAFFITRTRKGKTETARAEFDWANRKILYGYARDKKIAALEDGAQDLMSLAYHFSLSPPAPGRIRIPVTSGKGLDVREIEVLPEEVIETPMGQLRALPLRQIVRPGKDHLELWLAVQYHYLPVRLRHFDRAGDYTGEQVAIEIRVSDERELAQR